MRGDPLSRLRKICLALPEASEKLAWGEPTFRVCNKLFAIFANNHHRDGRVAVWCKAPLGVQEILVGAAPKRFFVPPYVGHQGWIGVRLDFDVDWDELAGILKDSYRMSAPKRLAVQINRPAESAARVEPAEPKRRSSSVREPNRRQTGRPR